MSEVRAGYPNLGHATQCTYPTVCSLAYNYKDALDIREILENSLESSLRRIFFIVRGHDSSTPRYETTF